MNRNCTKLWVLMAMLWFTLSVSAYDFEVDGICYEITSFTGFTVKATSLSDINISEITIPNKVKYNGKELLVTEIATNFAVQNENLVSLKIDVNHIGQSAFKDCKSLNTLELQDSVRHIGDECFMGCSNIKQVITSNYLEEIGTSAFRDCHELVSFSNKRLSKIGGYSFYNCPKLVDIDFPEITYIPDYAFSNCSSLTNCNTPNISIIGNNAFSGCRSMDKYEFPKNLRKIGSYAFQQTGLTEVIIPDNIISIGRGAFNNCVNIVSITLGRGITSIYPIFEECNNLTELVILDSFNELELLPASYNGTYVSNYSYGGKYAEANGAQVTICPGFFSNSNLKSVYIGRNIKQPQCSLIKAEEFDRWAIYGYDGNVINRYYNVYNSPFSESSISKVIFGPCVSDIIMASPYNTTNDPDVWPGLIQIKDYEGKGVLYDSTENNHYTSRVKCTFRIKGIFEDCNSLEEILFIGSSIKLPEFAFKNCNNLTNITLPFQTEHIGKQAFMGCYNLQSIDLGKIKKINEDVFNGCEKISYINFLENTPPQYTTGFDFNIYTTTNLNVPESSIDKYKDVFPWSNFWNINAYSSLNHWCIIDDIVYHIEDNIASVTGNLIEESREVVLPDEIELNNSKVPVKNICSYAFQNSNIKSISIPASIDTFGENAFDGCNNLKTIRFEDGDSFLIFPNANTYSTSPTQTKTVNGNTISFGIRYFDGYFNSLKVESLYLGRNLSNLSRYSITQKYDNQYYIESYDSPFNNLRTLKSLVIGPSVSVLGPEEEFIQEVDLKVTSGVFERCNNIEEVSVMNLTPPIGVEFNRTIYDNAILVVPENSKELYQEAEGWKEFKNIFDGTETVMVNITLNMTELSLEIGKSVQLSAEIQPKEVIDNALIWSSSNPECATIDENGVVTALSEGTAILKLTVKDFLGHEHYATCNVSVIPKVLISYISIDNTIRYLKKNRKAHLNTVISPENASNKAIQWKSSDESIATIDENGNLITYNIGDVTFTASACDASGVTATYEMTIIPPTKGDSNDNDEVTVTDAVNTANFAVGNEVENFCFEAADVNEDNKITLSDAAGTIEEVLNQPVPTAVMKTQRMNRAPRASDLDKLIVDDFICRRGETSVVEVNLDNSVDYVALQADITLSDAMALEKVEVGPRSEAYHSLMQRNVGNNTVRIALFNLDNTKFADNDEAILKLTVKTADSDGNEIKLNNILASDFKGNEYVLTSTGGNGNGITGIDSIYDDGSMSVVASEFGVTVYNAEGKTIEIYTVEGAKVSSFVAESNAVSRKLGNGVYVVTVGDFAAKVIVK